MFSFRVCWSSKFTKLTGQGEYIYSLYDARELARKMNIEYPYLHHWYEQKRSATVGNELGR